MSGERNMLKSPHQSLMDYGQERWCYINIQNHVLPLPTRVLPQGGEGGGQLLLAADQGDVYIFSSSSQFYDTSSPGALCPVVRHGWPRRAHHRQVR